MVDLKKITEFLDSELDVSTFNDSSNNGLQVENSGQIERVCCGVDAGMVFFQESKRRNANMLICHHGISWGDSLKRITGLNYERINYLISNDMALYACHLPLDAHKRYGNNAQICKALGLMNLRPFGEYAGHVIGFEGKLPKPISYEVFKKRVAKVINKDLKCMDFGKRTVRTVAVVSGGAADEIIEAAQKGIDVYVSGEPALRAYIFSQDYGINAIFAGHYATEIFGVRKLADLIQKRFKINAEFVDLCVPF